MVMEFRIGDLVGLKKTHPCGGFSWEVIRVGADIGLMCKQCKRKILMPRSSIYKRIKSINECQIS